MTLNYFFLNLLLIFFIVDTATAVDRDIWQKPNNILSALDLDKENDVFCEIGAGTGYFSLKAAKYVKRVIATDINKKSLRELQQIAIDQGADNIETLVSTVSKSNIPNETCDVIFMAIVYHHLNDRTSYLREMAKALKKGGRFINLDNSYDVSAVSYTHLTLPTKRIV